MKKFLTIFMVIAVIGITVLMPVSKVLAGDDVDTDLDGFCDPGKDDTTDTTCSGTDKCPTVKDTTNACTGSSTASLDLGLNYATATGLGSKDVRTTISMIIKVAFTMLGIIAVCLFLLGGFKWMTAQGNEDGIEEAKKIMVAATVGLAIILAAYSLASFVVDNLLEATKS